MDYIRYLRGMIGNNPAIFVAAVILIRDSQAVCFCSAGQMTALGVS